MIYSLLVQLPLHCFPGTNKNAQLTILFEEWAGSNEDWSRSELIVQMKNSRTHTKRGSRKWLTRKELVEKYGDEQIADDIISHKLENASLAKSQVRWHPDLRPGNMEMRQFLVFDSAEEVDQSDEILESLFRLDDTEDGKCRKRGRSKEKNKSKKSKKSKKNKKSSSSSSSSSSDSSSSSSSKTQASGKTKKSRKEKKDKNNENPPPPPPQTAAEKKKKEKEQEKERKRLEKEEQKRIKEEEKKQEREQKREEANQKREAEKAKEKKRTQAKKDCCSWGLWFVCFSLCV